MPGLRFGRAHSVRPRRPVIDGWRQRAREHPAPVRRMQPALSDRRTGAAAGRSVWVRCSTVLMTADNESLGSWAALCLRILSLTARKACAVEQAPDKSKPPSTSYRETYRRHRKLFFVPVILGALAAAFFLVAAWERPISPRPASGSTPRLRWRRRSAPAPAVADRTAGGRRAGDPERAFDDPGIRRLGRKELVAREVLGSGRLRSRGDASPTLRAMSRSVRSSRARRF